MVFEKSRLLLDSQIATMENSLGNLLNNINAAAF